MWVKAARVAGEHEEDNMVRSCCAPTFEEVRWRIERNVVESFGLGASVYVVVDDETMVNRWYVAGTDRLASGTPSARPWRTARRSGSQGPA